MGAVIVVAIISGIVSLVSVVTNAFITQSSIRADAVRARESREAEDRRAINAREAEDRRLREDRGAEAQRREDQREADRQAVAGRRASEQASARWAAVRAVIEAENVMRASATMINVFKFRQLLTSLILLTDPAEANLRAALRQRSNVAGGGNEDVMIRAAWWHPWVSQWASDPSRPMVNAENDEGRAF